MQRVKQSSRIHPAFARAFSLALGLWVSSALGCTDEAKEETFPGQSGYSVKHDGINCVHPKVDKDCENGWCRIPKGCFLMGSPPEEASRGARNEELTAVSFTRGFFIQQTEVTVAQWGELIAEKPFKDFGPDSAKDCTEPSCPVGTISWQAATAFSNLMSERDGYEECYEHIDCTGELGTIDFVCENVQLTTETTHECNGYRLPTAAEWEYAARAGTRTSFYSGKNLREEAPCDAPAPETDAIAWSCHNSKLTSFPVGQKLPNGWGLYDMLGNVMEHTSWLEAEPDPPGPLIDPQKTLGRHDEKFDWWIVKGGNSARQQHGLRAADETGGPWDNYSPLFGFRLVRTLPVE